MANSSKTLYVKLMQLKRGAQYLTDNKVNKTIVGLIPITVYTKDSDNEQLMNFIGNLIVDKLNHMTEINDIFVDYSRFNIGEKIQFSLDSKNNRPYIDINKDKKYVQFLSALETKVPGVAIVNYDKFITSESIILMAEDEYKHDEELKELVSHMTRGKDDVTWE